MRALSLFTAALLAAGLAQAATAPASATLTYLTFTPYSVSSNGTVVGDDITRDQLWSWNASQGTRYIGGVTNINPGAGIALISADGARIVGATLGSDGVRRPSLYNPTSGQWQALAGFGGYSRSAGASSDASVNSAAFNSIGAIQGMSRSGLFAVGNAYQAGNGSTNSRAALWNLSSGTVTNLGSNPIANATDLRTRANGVSDDGKVVGGFGANSAPLVWTDYDGDGSYAVIKVSEAGGMAVSAVTAVSADGRWVAGNGLLSTAHGQAYRFNPASSAIEMLGQLSPSILGNANAATAINADGSVIVGYESNGQSTAQGRTGFIWTATSGIQSLNSYLASYGLDAGGFNFSTPMGISADGRSIVGFGYATGSNIGQGFLVTIPSAVPEPASYALALLGLGLLCGATRHRRRPAQG
jgi:hypothetical protein